MKNILIAVSGLTPQVVSETFFCLCVQKKIPLHEIYIVTTIEGKKNIKEYYFNNRVTGKKEGPFNLRQEISDMCKLYKITPPAFSETSKYIIIADEETLQMPDVRTDNENRLFPNLISNFIRKKSRDNNTALYCSLSGGRKTMSAYMGFALSIYARENDKLYHVLADDKFEKTGKFYPHKKDNGDSLVLSEVPFLRLRNILADKIDIEHKSYGDMIDFSQQQIEKMSADIMFIDTKEHKITVNNKSFKMPAIQLAVYLYIISKKLEPDDEIMISDYQTKQVAAEVMKIYCKLTRKPKEEHESKLNEAAIKSIWWNKGIRNIMSIRTKINDLLDDNIDDAQLADEYYIRTNKVYGSSRYDIYASYNRFIVI